MPPVGPGVGENRGMRGRSAIFRVFRRFSKKPFGKDPGAPSAKVTRPRASDGSLYRCPCCHQPTLEERGANEICHACFWQDGGQDDPVADEMWGGGNGDLSLTQARENFLRCGAYDPRIGFAPAGEGEADSKTGSAPEAESAAHRHREPKGRRPKGAPTPPGAHPPGPKTAGEPSYEQLLESIPETLPARPPPRPPRPTPVWARPISIEQMVPWVARALVLLLVAACVHCYTSGWLTGQMLKDHGYYLWAHGKERYKPEYLAAFARDPRFRQRYVGHEVDSLHGLFPRLYGGARYDPDRLRALNPGHTFVPGNTGEPFQTYWLDQLQPGITYCVLVVDGKVADFFFADRGSR